MTSDKECPYCHLDEAAQEPAGGWICRDAHWLVSHGPPGTSMPGALKITSRRHFTDFADMTGPEAASFGPLLTRLDTAMREVTGGERVHLVSTRGRVQHFHPWLHPTPGFLPLAGTGLLNAPQRSHPAEAEVAARAIRHHLTASPPSGG